MTQSGIVKSKKARRRGIVTVGDNKTVVLKAVAVVVDPHVFTRRLSRNFGISMAPTNTIIGSDKSSTIEVFSVDLNRNGLFDFPGSYLSR